MTKKERLKSILTKLNVSEGDFERKAGLAKGAVSNLGENPRMTTLDKIKKAYPEINITWLLTEEGEMFISSSATPENTNYTKPDYDSTSEFNNIEIDMNNPTAKYFMGVIEKLISQGERNSIANERNSIANERNSIANEENAKTISKMVSMLETMLYSSNKLKTKSAGE
jgi:hypothetical protein